MTGRFDYEFTTCSCGKEFHIRTPFHKLSIACPACEALFAIWHDNCPATVYTSWGASACMLPFRHTGKCQRDDSFDEEIARIAKERAERGSGSI